MTYHGPSNVKGVAFSDFGTCLITNFNSKLSERKTFLHEIGHFYGLKDHYGGSVLSTDQMNAEAGETIYSGSCMYGENRETSSVLTNLTMCEGCQRTIRANMNKFDHE